MVVGELFSVFCPSGLGIRVLDVVLFDLTPYGHPFAYSSFLTKDGFPFQARHPLTKPRKTTLSHPVNCESQKRSESGLYLSTLGLLSLSLWGFFFELWEKKEKMSSWHHFFLSLSFVTPSFSLCKDRSSFVCLQAVASYHLIPFTPSPSNMSTFISLFFPYRQSSCSREWLDEHAG